MFGSYPRVGGQLSAQPPSLLLDFQLPNSGGFEFAIEREQILRDECAPSLDHGWRFACDVFDRRVHASGRRRIDILNRAEEALDVIERGEAERRAGAWIRRSELFQFLHEGFESLLHRLITCAFLGFGNGLVDRVETLADRFETRAKVIEFFRKFELVVRSAGEAFTRGSIFTVSGCV